mgnify:CR=1 FL=1
MPHTHTHTARASPVLRTFSKYLREPTNVLWRDKTKPSLTVYFKNLTTFLWLCVLSPNNFAAQYKLCSLQLTQRSSLKGASRRVFEYPPFWKRFAKISNSSLLQRIGPYYFFTFYCLLQSQESARRQHHLQSNQKLVPVVVHSLDRNNEPELLRPQEVRTVEIPWYEQQVGACLVCLVN